MRNCIIPVEEVLLADKLSNRVRKIDRHGMITTIAGNGERGFNGDGGLATKASLYYPTGVFQYKQEIYIADCDNGRIRKIDRSGIISTITNRYHLPHSLFVHNDVVYFSTCLHQLFKILPNGTIKTIAGLEKKSGFNGDDKLAIKCIFNSISGIFVDDESQIYIADSFNHCIRRIDRNKMMRRVIGTGVEGYSGDVPFDFYQYPHIGPRKKPIKTFPQAYHDLIVICMD